MEFAKFAAKNNKFYTTAEEFDHRRGNWKKNHDKVKVLNKKNTAVQFDDNFTSDLLDEEFNAMLGLDTTDLVADNSRRLSADNETEEGRRRLAISRVNWVEAGKVSPVKNQGYCGSCWSFAGTLAQETMQAIADDAAPIRLSEQQGVDCTTNTQANMDMFGKVYGTYGCRGGWMARYWNFTRDNGAITNADYPYTSLNYQSGEAVKSCSH